MVNTLAIVLIVIGIVAIIYSIVSSSGDNNTYFINKIALRAWHDNELLEMLDSGFIYGTGIKLTKKDKEEIEKELTTRNISPPIA